ncbi:MAG: alpha/beta hydrolase [Verrucomicrobiales bacterium]
MRRVTKRWLQRIAALAIASILIGLGFSLYAGPITNRMRMRFGGTAPLLAPLLIWQIEPRLGIGPDRLRPVRAIADVRSPVFILCGSTDQHATPAESQALFSAASEPREFWQVIGAAHVDLHRFAGHEYERRIIEFLATLNRAQPRPQ